MTVGTAPRQHRRLPCFAACMVFAALGPGCAQESPAGLAGLDPVVIVEQARASDWPAAPKQILAARLAGDQLSLDVSYSGGCATHDFRLIVSRTFAESFPVQTWSVLAHDDRRDPCDAVIGETLIFDLSPLREAYRAAYGAGPAEVMLHLEGLASSIRYAF